MDRNVIEDLINQGKGYRTIATELGVSLSTIRHWSKKYDLRSPIQRWNKKPHLCESCGETDSSSFYGNRKTKCKKCFISDDVEISILKKKRAVGYMGGKCISCGYDRYCGALQFHHIDRSTKGDWRNLRNWGWERIKRELENCVMVCATCHAEIHGGMIDDSNMNPGPPK